MNDPVLLAYKVIMVIVMALLTYALAQVIIDLIALLLQRDEE